MKIGLIDVDGHNYPNLPLMKLSAWHKAHGDSVEWYEPMFSGHMDRVYMSKVFSFSPDYEYFVDADEIIRGGSGYCIELKDGREHYCAERDQPLPDEVEHIYPDYGLYGITDTAYGFLTRRCPRGCSFCHVAAKEGRKSRKVADLSEFWRGQKNIVLCDPNILACPDRMDLLQQLADSKALIDVNQGMDIRLVTDDVIDIMNKIRFKSIHFAFDRYQDREIVEPKLRMFAEKTHFDKDKGKVTVYILVNYDSTLVQDLYRIQLCRELRLQPYPMIYDKEHCDSVYKRLQRWCSPYIFWKCNTFEEYTRRKP